MDCLENYKNYMIKDEHKSKGLAQTYARRVGIFVENTNILSWDELFSKKRAVDKFIKEVIGLAFQLIYGLRVQLLKFSIKPRPTTLNIFCWIHVNIFQAIGGYTVNNINSDLLWNEKRNSRINQKTNTFIVVLAHEPGSERLSVEAGNLPFVYYGFAGFHTILHSYITVLLGFIRYCNGEFDNSPLNKFKKLIARIQLVRKSLKMQTKKRFVYKLFLNSAVWNFPVTCILHSFLFCF